MKFGVSCNTGAYGVVDPDAMIAVARHAEDCGFESFYVPAAGTSQVRSPSGKTIRSHSRPPRPG
jgi:hypothetical protein